MKKLSLILAAVMLLAMFVPAVSITSVAADATYEAEVTDAAGATTQYKTVAEAVAAATDGSTVKVIAEEVIVDNPLRVYGNNVTFDGGNALFKFTPSEDGKALFEVAGGYADDGAKGNLYYTGYGDAIANLEVGKVTIKNVNFEPTLDIALGSTNVAFKGEQGSGIRFNSTVAADLIAYANEKKDFGTELKYGTVITAADYLDCANQDDYTVSPEELTRRGLAYQDVAAVNGITENADGSVSFNAVLAGITGKNANRDFAAVAYVEYVKDGHAVRVYGLYDPATGSANMADLAVAALADVSLTESATHMYKTADGKYSPYTAEQQAVLAVYAGLDK